VYQLNLRYPGQNWSLTVTAADATGPADLSFVEPLLAGRVAERFHALHRKAYGHARLSEVPQVTGVRLVTSAATPRPKFGSGFSAPAREATPAGMRRANLGRGLEDTAVHRGPELEPGQRVAAPAVIEETFTTIVVYPGWQATVDDAGDYVLERVGPLGVS